jgi:hypothetical protein
MEHTDLSLPRLSARMAGILWLLTIVTGLFGEAFVRSRLITNDPDVSLSNIFANPSLYRLGEAALCGGTAAYLALSAIMYRLLAPVSKTVSLIAVFFSIAGCIIWLLALVGDLSPFILLPHGLSLTDSGFDTQKTLAFGLMRLHSETLLLGMLCFGIHCLLMGILVIRATFLPAILGIILALGGMGYVLAEALHILAPQVLTQYGKILFIPGEVGEALMGLWLAVLGANSAKWTSMHNAAKF